MQQRQASLKIKRLEARVSANQKQLFQHAADLLGWSLTDFTIKSLQEKANQVIKEHEIMQISRNDQDTFIKAIFNPPKPNDALSKAVNRYNREVE